MPSDSFDHRRTTTAKPHHTGGSAAVAPPPEPEHLPCPRCDSTNTKFCYYNNYNFSQPRHFCKTCRRYWTHGGTLRDIPVGGGSRRNAKRSRLTTTTTTNSHYNSTLDQFRHMAPVPAAAPILFPFTGDHGGALRFSGDGICESFTSLLNSAQGFGVGGFDDGGFAFGRGVWPFSGVGDGGHYGVGGVGVGGGGGECLSLPELAISTPGGM